MGRAVINVSLNFLEDLLKTQETPFQWKVSNGLPEDARLVEIEVSDSNQILRVVFESEFIENMLPGVDIPTIAPKFTKFIKPYSWQP